MEITCEVPIEKKKRKRAYLNPLWIVLLLIIVFTILITLIVMLIIMKPVDVRNNINTNTTEKATTTFTVSSIIDTTVLITTETPTEPTVKLAKNVELERKKPSNCFEAAGGVQLSGIYNILVPEYGEHMFKVVCNEEYYCGGWTVIMQRVNGVENFYRNWVDYKQGFGNLDYDFWIGLDKMHALTSGKNQELLVILKTDSEIRVARYDLFEIGDEASDYAIVKLGNYSGTAGDSLTYHKGQKFLTKDRSENAKNCAFINIGAWWFKNCLKSHLNARYTPRNADEKGIEWRTFKGRIKFAQMMIRPANLNLRC